MRVIAGRAKGHRLKASPSIRPTTNLVRGALFSMLEASAGAWERGLDLYAGSGALGIEALSRGVGWVDFVEREPRNCARIKENLTATGLSSQTHVYCASVKKALSFLQGSYDLIFLDPPYSLPSLGETVAQVAASPLVGSQSRVALCHSSQVSLEPRYGPLTKVKERRHGDTTISIFQWEGS